ncbi:hypothetical protein ATZ36_08640 [Candidatus Endomicrobiellum trichonymphae]|uniref:Uncharacterized protein n=1 Tax=Endomicrobium trichonymphae TaxID=1408204 RepID=A0A1E5IHV4_ENDTX|nr:hypothetical protein ATZ36_08640 [Candidatus Endomicrobium trichonymphae]
MLLEMPQIKLVNKNIEYNIVKKEMDIDNYPESESSAIVKERGNIYGADKLLTLKENAGRDLYNSYRNYEKKDKETLEYQEKTEKNKKELDDFMNKNFEKM